MNMRGVITEMTNEPEHLVAKVRIKNGAQIFQDHLTCKWPNCCPPKRDYENEEYRYWAKDPTMVFDGIWDGKCWDCKTDGYGFFNPDDGEYGNGSISVEKFTDVEILDDEPKTDREKKSQTLLNDMFTAAIQLAQYASYAEIVGGISVNRAVIRTECDNIYDINKQMDICEYESNDTSDVETDDVVVTISWHNLSHEKPKRWDQCIVAGIDKKPIRAMMTWNGKDFCVGMTDDVYKEQNVHWWTSWPDNITSHNSDT